MLIADLTGYTVFLQESELEHAQGSLTALHEIMVAGTRPLVKSCGIGWRTLPTGRP